MVDHLTEIEERILTNSLFSKVGPYFVSSFFFQRKFTSIRDQIVYTYNPLTVHMKFSTRPLLLVAREKGEGREMQ